MMIDIEKVRGDTPGSETLIHLNNAGSSLPATSTLAAHKAYLDLEAREGGYEATTIAEGEIARFYTASAKLLNCDPGEIAFQSGASEAWWRAFLAVNPQPGDRVLAGTTEFQSAAFGLLQARNRGVIVEMIPDDASGQVDLAALSSMLEQPTKVVCLTQIAMSNGLVNPVEQIGSMIRDAGALYLLDACQAAGQMPLDVDVLQCDFLTATGRKWLRGPRGSGMLYVRDSILDSLTDPVFVDGRSAVWDTADTYQMSQGSARFELQEMNPGGKVGLGAAVAYALDIGLDAIEERVLMLATTLRSKLRDVPGVTVTDRGEQLCGIVTFVSDALSPGVISRLLHEQRINVSAPEASNSRFMFDAVGVDAVVRAAPHYYNTEEELDRFVSALSTIVSI
ncbi:MAG: aminotransferase class V-fold PLP-dependent enzyme [Acidimicrobiia bacterium]|nr:MAG: aminotransferase class V-fold PLP-dependent enzyme [Acidimicrobiia bacterium]